MSDGGGYDEERELYKCPIHASQQIRVWSAVLHLSWHPRVALSLGGLGQDHWGESLSGLGKHGLHVASPERVPPLLQLPGSRSQLSNAPPSISIHHVLSELWALESRHPSRHSEPSRDPREAPEVSRTYHPLARPRDPRHCEPTKPLYPPMFIHTCYITQPSHTL